jgi:hypothetical protein
VQVKALEDELHRSQTALGRMPNNDIRSYVARLWFDLLAVRSERAYLETLVGALKLALTDDGT